MTDCYYSVYCDLTHDGDATTQNHRDMIIAVQRSSFKVNGILVRV
jgi:hypothetical protein